MADLFAGSGALGIEALSRGAAFATFVEVQRHMASCLRANLETCDLKEKARVLVDKVDSVLTRLPADDLDLVFADPPYARRWPDDQGWRELCRILRPGGFFVLESGMERGSEPDRRALMRTFSRTYGDTRLEVFRKGGSEDG